MQEENFRLWLMRRRKHQRQSADSHVGRVKACEAYFGLDLDSAARRGLIPGMIEQTKLRDQLRKTTRDSYITALRRYAEFAK
jgi:hypothetical protein